MPRHFVYSITFANGLCRAVSLDALAASDLPASGVSPGTYGDASHFPVITVDAQGRVTDVTLQAGGGGATYSGDGTTITLSGTTFSIASSGVSTAKLADGAVTYAKMQNVAASSLLGNPTGSLAAPSEVTPDGTTILFSGTALMTPAPKVYNAILQGGCKGDGVADDTTAARATLVAARAAGVPMYFPKATYSVDLASADLFVFSASNDTLLGDGPGQTVFKSPDSQAITGASYFVHATAGRNQRVSGVTFAVGANPSGASVSSVSAIVAGGTGYADGDTITLAFPAGNTGNTRTVLTLQSGATAGGVITTLNKVSVTTGGSWQAADTAAGHGTQFSTSGSGVNATFTLSFSTSRSIGGVYFDNGTFDWVGERIEGYGFYGANPAGAFGLNCSSTFNQPEYTPTLGTDVSAGAFANATPSSIFGCGTGRRIAVDTATASGRQTAILAQVSAPGTSYLVGDVVTEAGSGTATTHAQFYVGALRAVSVASIVAGGTNYAVNDLITVVGGTTSAGPYGVAAVLKVLTLGASNAVATVSIATAGSYATTPGAGTLTTTGGTGSGATVTLTYSADQVGCLQTTGASAIAAAGTLYNVNDLLALTGGTFGQPAVYIVTAVNAGGGVTAVRPVLGGTYSVAPTNPVSVGTAWFPSAGTASAGTGCTLTLNAFSFTNGTPVLCGKYSVSSSQPAATTGGTGSNATLNIYYGPEPVICLYDNKTSFTAWFQVDHLSTAPCGVYATGTGQRGVFRDSYVHDSLYCTGIGGTGVGVRWENVRVVNVGAYGATQHGAYWQGGSAVFDTCYFENCGANSIQIQESLPNLDASHNKVVNCVSVNPGANHLVVNQADSPNQINNANNFACNPDVPLGDALNRACEVIGNTIRCTKQSAYAPSGVILNAPTEFVGNTLEDCCGNLLDSRAGWIGFSGSGNAAGSKIIGNRFRVLNALQTGSIIGTGADNVIVEGNSFENVGGNGGVVNAGTAKGWLVRGNNVQLTNTFGGTVFTLGSNFDLSANVVAGGQPGLGSTKPFAFALGSGATGSKVHDNDFSGMPAACCVAQLSNSVPVSVYGNNWTGTLGLRLSGTTAPVYGTTSVVVYNNDGKVTNAGVTGSALTRDSGLLQNATTGTGGVTAGKLCKYDGSGGVVLCLTGDTGNAVAGIATSTNNASLWVMIASDVGAVVPAVVDSNGCTAGNIGTLSGVTAATVADSGSQVTIPSAGFACRFLTTVGANGTALVKIIRLQ